MNKIFVSFCLLSALLVMGNATMAQSPTTTVEEAIFVVVENEPEFPGGMDALFEFLGTNIQYPAEAMERNISGTVYVTFVVEKDGSISNPKVLRDIGGGCGAEVVRVVKSMPKWKPGTQRGKPVRVQFNLPCEFNLSDSEEE